MSKKTVSTGTHYIYAGGHRYLPTCMQRRRLRAGDIIMRGYETADAREADDVSRACRALGIDTYTVHVTEAGDVVRE